MFTPTRQPGLVEFTLLIAAITSILALGIDAILPAMPAMSAELGLSDPNTIQLTVTYYLLGMGFGMLFFGPASDSFGRKPMIYAGMMLFLAGSIICSFSTDYNTMIIGRLIQGVGVSAPRAITMSLVRDLYAGREMARVMSIVSAVFILVPAIAPTLGVAILSIGSWRLIFVLILVFGFAVLIWLAVRQPETLPRGKRNKFNVANIVKGAVEVVTTRDCVAAIFAAGLSSAALFGYLGASQQIFADAFNLGDYFHYFFGAIALSIGAASVVNSRVVVRYGMRFLSRMAAAASTTFGMIYLIALLTLPIGNNVVIFMIWALPTFFCLGIMFGNIFSIGMVPLGHIAGIGSAVLGSTSTLLSAGIGGLIGQTFQGSVVPIVLGFVVLHAATYLIIRIMLAAPETDM
ncbi:multidrug effflux MFS transporter [Abyssibius alkaniclasticus]|uniref:multidrug effflux MFS transporter n=1 Tax=Abyssibius alkaniclasticus TaxID=2881234 RepID=UPI00236376C7|nr:multidrug effflux MFS transporter [Abyssibius alkaniclasticus]UPH70753.1 multidrug effflux MFS transporter [Abyssibius alkaniclasticus]